MPAHQRRDVSPAVVRIAAISLITIYALMGTPARALADDGPSEPSLRPWPWPCQLIVIGELRELLELAWEHSPTFRDQCGKLAAARATMIVEPGTPRETLRATTRIMKTEAGVTFARARVLPAENALELIAHELEHVIEFTDGVKYLLEAGTGRTGVSLIGGAYETRRAIDAGRRVAREVRAARDARNSPLSTLTQNSTRNPNCH